ncbi:MAG: prolipoprotein diacylglyceryl transferase [Anaerolineales bacterium]
MYPPDDPIAFTIPLLNFPVRWFGLIIMAAVLAGGWVASREARRRKLNPDLVWEAVMWVLIGGIVGARLYHVLTPPPSMGMTTLDYLRNPLQILNIPAGGLGIPGGITGGFVGLYLFARRNRLDFMTLADLGGLAAPLGQAIGRTADLFNQELYGPPTPLPWGMYIDAPYRIAPYTDLTRYPLATTQFHPLWLYESLWSALGFGVLYAVYRRFGKRLHTGDLFWLYLVWYSIGRFFLEFIRLDRPNISGVSIAQALSAGVALVAASVLIYRHRPSKASDAAKPKVEAQP